MKLWHYISFNIIASSNLTFEMKMQFRKQEKSYTEVVMVSIESAALAQTCISQKCQEDWWKCIESKYWFF